jgi:hypothetical protein
MYTECIDFGKKLKHGTICSWQNIAAHCAYTQNALILFKADTYHDSW